jgi:hypothetical protein
MIITKLIEPWNHFIVEHFFPDSILPEIQSNFVEKTGYEPWTGYPHRFGKSISIHSPKTYDYLCSVLPTFIKVCEEDLIERNLPLDASCYDVFHDMFCIDDVGYTVPLHTDNSAKCITFVIYINGKGSCTSLCKKYGSEFINSFASDEFRDRKNSCDSDPIPNSALIFVPKNSITYHTVQPTKAVRNTVQFAIQLKECAKEYTKDRVNGCAKERVNIYS